LQNDFRLEFKLGPTANYIFFVVLYYKIYSVAEDPDFRRSGTWTGSEYQISALKLTDSRFFCWDLSQ
jgi:hypothetical protein